MCEPNIMEYSYYFIIIKMNRKSLAQSIAIKGTQPQPISPAANLYQQCINKLSEHPRYQHLLVISISLFWFIITFNAMIGSFVFMNPLFTCNGVAKNQPYACQHKEQCILTNSFTAVKKNKLYCQKQDIRSTIQSIFALGLVIGMIVVPISGDVVGRRRTLISTFFIGVLGYSVLLISIDQNSQFFMIVGSVLNGVFGSGITILGFILTCDFCQQKLRQRSLILYCAIWGIAEMMFYIFYEYMPEWDKYLTYTLFLPTSFMLIFLIFFKVQSPAFALFVKKDINLFKKIVTQLSRYNKISAQQKVQIIKDGQQIISLVTKVDNQDEKKEARLKQILKKIIFQRANLISCICLVIPLVSFNFFYYGMQGSMERTGLNFGINMLLIGLNQFLGYLSASYVTKFIRRKVGTIVSVIFTCSVGLLFLLQFVKEQQVVQTILAVLARVGSVYAYCFILLLQSELLQVQIRSTAVAIIVSIGQITRIIVPYIINSLNNIGIPIIIISSFFFLILGTLPIIALRQTLKTGKELKEQLKQDDIEQI